MEPPNPPPNTNMTPADPHVGLWAHSIAKIYSDAGLAISQPSAPSDFPPSLLTTFPALHQQVQYLHDHALYLPGDLHSGQQWIHPAPFPTVLCPHLQQLIHAPVQPPPPRPIHAGQFWHLSPPCRRTHNEPSMKSSRPRHRIALSVPASGSSQ